MFNLLNQYNDVNFRHPLMRGIVSRWKVVPNFVGGNRLVDLCGRNHGVLTNNPTWASAMGRPGGSGSLYFDGTNDSVNCGSLITFAAGEAFTLAIWMLAPVGSDLSESPGLLAKYETGVSIYMLRLRSTGRVIFDVKDTSANRVEMGDIAATDSDDGKWHHLVGVCIPGGTNSLYIDGNLKVSASAAAISATVTGGAGNLTIGNTGADGREFEGYLDDAMIIRRGLSASEVLALYQATRQQDDPTLNYNNFYYPYIYPRYDGRFTASPFDCPIIQGVV